MRRNGASRSRNTWNFTWNQGWEEIKEVYGGAGLSEVDGSKVGHDEKCKREGKRSCDGNRRKKSYKGKRRKKKQINTWGKIKEKEKAKLCTRGKRKKEKRRKNEKKWEEKNW